MRHSIYSIPLALVLALMLSQNVSAGSISADLQAVLNTAGPSQKIAVIVLLKDRVNLDSFRDQNIGLRRKKIITALKEKAAATQRPVLDFLMTRNAERVKSLWLINGLTLTIRAGTIAQLAARPGVAEVRLDDDIPLSEPETDALSAAAEWNIDAILAPRLWDLGHTGQGVVVASMDTGVDLRHPDLGWDSIQQVNLKWRGGSNSWYDPNGEHPAIPTDTHGHDTRTMGIMVGGNQDGTAVGVAPGAQWIAVKIFKDAVYPNPPVAPLSSIHAGFQWILDPDGNPDSNDAPDMVNNSWEILGTVNECNPEFHGDIDALKAAGIAVVFAAGNSGPGYFTSVSPANYPAAFAVGAVDENVDIAGFSSRGTSACDHGSYPDVVAPGDNNSPPYFGIKTTDLTDGGANPYPYAYVSGSSYAAPHVTGAMALIRGALPDAAVSDIESALKNKAVDLGLPGADNDYGHGLIDVLAAYRSLAACTDGDHDGYYVESTCSLVPDCDDSDGSVHPGAVEIKHDTIDQDCNGYDLTIDILQAEYLTPSDTICVAATSDLLDGAGLELAGYSPMIWNTELQTWFVRVGGAGGNPGTVVVSGIEGAETAATVVLETEICKADLDRDGDVDAADLLIFEFAYGTRKNIDPEYNPAADFDQNDIVDAPDLAEIALELGRLGCPHCY